MALPAQDPLHGGAANRGSQESRGRQAREGADWGGWAEWAQEGVEIGGSGMSRKKGLQKKGPNSGHDLLNEFRPTVGIVSAIQPTV